MAPTKQRQAGGKQQPEAKSKITLEQWQFDIGASEQDGEGWTAAEVASRCGWSTQKARRMLGFAIQGKRWRLTGFRRGTTIHGNTKRTPVYAPVRE